MIKYMYMYIQHIYIYPIWKSAQDGVTDEKGYTCIYEQIHACTCTRSFKNDKHYSFFKAYQNHIIPVIAHLYVMIAEA